jgi:hypothetical protein
MMEGRAGIGWVWGRLIYFAITIMNDFFPGESRKKITSLFNSERRYSRSGSITTTALDK